jgi:hypothetical protein
MSGNNDPPRYRSYLLRFWQERSKGQGGTSVWHFSLEDPHTGLRRGFANLEALIAVVQREIDQVEGAQLVDPLR